MSTPEPTKVLYEHEMNVSEQGRLGCLSSWSKNFLTRFVISLEREVETKKNALLQIVSLEREIKDYREIISNGKAANARQYETIKKLREGQDLMIKQMAEMQDKMVNPPVMVIPDNLDLRPGGIAFLRHPREKILKDANDKLDGVLKSLSAAQSHVDLLRNQLEKTL